MVNKDVRNLVEILNEGKKLITATPYIDAYISNVLNMSKNRLSTFEIVKKYTENYFKYDYDKVTKSLLDIRKHYE